MISTTQSSNLPTHDTTPHRERIDAQTILYAAVIASFVSFLLITKLSLIKTQRSRTINPV
ncbi:MAG TPA: hypothetical protein VL134_12260 [Leptolyngbya sp.]|nr:hypothetical protein [Leptolyngbya sp.]